MYYKFSVSASKFQHFAACALLSLTLAGCGSDTTNSTIGQPSTSAATQPFIVNGVPRTSIQAGSMYRYTPVASSPDARVVSYTIVNKPEWAVFVDTTGELFGTPNAADVGASGEIQINASDGTNRASVGPFRINVTALQSGAAPSTPTIAGTPATSVVAGQPYSFTPTVTDPSGASLSYSIVNRPTWATFNSASGALSGNPKTANVGSAANIVISVSTTGAPVSLPPFAIQVLAAADSAPTISGSPAGTVAAGGDYSFTPVAGDPDGNALTFSVLSAPSWMSFNTKTGELSGTAPTSVTASFFSNIVISVSDGTLSASLPAFSITVQASGGGGGGGGGKTIKFHPGYYVELDQNGSLAQWLSTIASIKGSHNVVGVALIQPWSALEFAEGVFTSGSGTNAQGFAMVDQLLAACAGGGLHLILGYEDRSFGGPTQSMGSEGQLPPYFDTLENGNPGYNAAPLGTTFNGEGLQMIADVLNPTVWAREIALGAAYLSRYDSNPNFEMWRSPETANSEWTSTASYDQYIAQYQLWMPAMRAAGPHTQVSISSNFVNDAGEFTTLFTGAQQSGIGMGGPDVSLNAGGGNPPFLGTSNLVFNGYTGGRDWRGTLPWVSEVQWPDINGQGPSFLNQLYSEAVSGSIESGGSIGPNYFLIDQVFEDTSVSLGDILAFIGGNNPLNISRPSSIH